MGKSWRTAFSPKHRGFTLDAIKTWISALGLLATVTAGVGLYLNYQQGQEKLVTDRFTKAVEQLGSKEPDVLIGAVYSLERIAKDSSKDHWAIIEVLTAFVRNKSPLPKDWKPNSKQALPYVTTDMQSALTVIGRREVRNDREGESLSLVSTNLSGASFTHANLSVASLTCSNLNKASFNGANLYLTFFKGANLSGAVLDNAYVKEARFISTYGMTTAQIQAARGWQYAHYDPSSAKRWGYLKHLI